jgi:hypothetical protein
MIRHGVAPFLECSSRGDSRFSAFYASVNGRTIEEQFQGAKIFLVADTSDGPVFETGLHWRKAKGRKAYNPDEVADLYRRLWDNYIAHNPELKDVLRAATGLSDIFGQPGHCCQATELWRIKQSL